MGKSKSENQGYCYDFIVERKYPLLRLLVETKTAINTLNYIHSPSDIRKKETVERRRQYIKDRLQIIYWIMETMAQNSPDLVEGGGYMLSYKELETTYPKAIKVLDKVISLKEDEVKIIKDVAMDMQSFISEST